MLFKKKRNGGIFNLFDKIPFSFFQVDGLFLERRLKIPNKIGLQNFFVLTT